MKTILYQRMVGKLAVVLLFLLTGSAMAHPGHGAVGAFHHFPGPFAVLLAIAAAWVTFRIASRNTRS